MWKNFVFILIFVFANMYFSSARQIKKETHKMYSFQHLEPFSMEDFKKPPSFDDPKVCHYPNFHCLSQANELEPVCAFRKNYGLINYENVCKVHILNCLAQPKGTEFVYGVPTEHDVIYWNGVDISCEYYLKQSKGLENAVKLYYKIGYETETTTEIENTIYNVDVQRK